MENHNDMIVERIVERLSGRELFQMVSDFCDDNSWERPMTYEDALDFLRTKDIEDIISHVKNCPDLTKGDARFYYYTLDGYDWLKVVDLVDEYIDANFINWLMDDGNKYYHLLDLDDFKEE